jgi:hypothetical protein
MEGENKKNEGEGEKKEKTEPREKNEGRHLISRIARKFLIELNALPLRQDSKKTVTETHGSLKIAKR